MSESSVAGKMAENRRFFGHKLRGYLMSESSGRQERRRGKKDRCPLIARKVAENRGFPAFHAPRYLMSAAGRGI